MTENSLAVNKKNNLRAIMRQESIVERFNEVLGNSLSASAYISSVLLEVANREELQKCSANSIIASAIRAATLRLSVDSATGQAYLVPFKGICTLIVGYRGIYQMALRTNKYVGINLIDVHECDNLVMDMTTGDYYIQREGKRFIPALQRSDTPIVGHLLYFKLTNGFQKTFFMSCKECEDHGAKYSKTYHLDNSIWKKEPEKMHSKTVIRLGLLKWGYLDPGDLMAMNADESETVEGETRYTDEGEDGVTVEPLSESQNPKAQPTYEEYVKSMRLLGFEPDAYDVWEKKNNPQSLETMIPAEPPATEDQIPTEPEMSSTELPAETKPEKAKYVTSTMYWNAANKAFNNDHEKGKAFLLSHQGNIAAAYEALTKEVGS